GILGAAGCILRHLEVYTEHTSFGTGALESERPAHCFGQSLRQGEAQTGTFDFGLFSAQPVEGRKQLVDLVSGNSAPGILHADHETIVAAVIRWCTAATQVHCPVTTIVLDRVCKKVQQHLCETLPVCAHV